MTGTRYWRMLAAVLGLLLGLATPARAAWHEAQSDRFVIYADAAPEWLRDYAVDLERYDRALRRIFPAAGPGDPAEERPNRLRVFVVTGPDALQRVLGDRVKNAAGFYTARLGRSAAFTIKRGVSSGPFALDPDTVLRHEYAHHFMYRNSAVAYPPWFSEGFAEVVSNIEYRKNGEVLVGLTPAYRLGGLLLGPDMSVTQVLTSPVPRGSLRQTDAFYGRSWLLAHYMLLDRTRAPQFSTYLKLFSSGTPSADAAASAFGDLVVLDREVDRYLKQRKLAAVVIRGTDPDPASITIRPLSAPEAAMMPAVMAVARNSDPLYGPGIAEQARKLAAPFPNDPAAQTVLAEAELIAGNLDAAAAAIDRALAAGPQTATMLTVKGEIEIRRARDALGGGDALRAARGWFVKANRLEPNNARALVGYVDTLWSPTGVVTANARAALARAFELAPEDDSLRARYGVLLLMEKDAKGARNVLASLAFSPHGGGEGPFRDAVAEIDAGRPEAALEVLRRRIMSPR